MRSQRSQTGRVGALQARGLTYAAIQAATSPAATAGIDRLSAPLAAQTKAAQRRFVGEAASATGALAGLTISIAVVALLVAALAVIGLRRRLQEYR